VVVADRTAVGGGAVGATMVTVERSRTAVGDDVGVGEGVQAVTKTTARISIIV